MSIQDEVKDMFFRGSNTEAEMPDSEEPQDEQDDIGTAGSEGLAEEESEEEEIGRETSEDSDSSEESQEEVETGEEEGEDSLEQRYARVLEQLNAANAELLNFKSVVVPEVTDPNAQISEQAIIQPPQEIKKFALNEELVNKAIIEGDPKAFSEVLTSFADHVSQVIESQKINLLTSIPQMATQMAVQRVKLQTAIDAFYSDNEDLIPHRSTVGMVANKVVAENPNYSLKEVFEETEKQTRKLIGLKKKIISKRGDADKQSFKQKQGSRKGQKPVLTGLKADIAAMQNARR